MMRMTWVIVIAASCAMVGTAAWAATKDEPKIGVVDVQRVIKDAPRMKQYSEELEAFKQTLSTKMFLRARNEMLDENEIKELLDLKTKASPTSADNARVKALTDTERSRDDELKKLQETNKLDDAQKARMKELQELQRKSKEVGEAATKDSFDQLESKSADVWAKAESEMQVAVSKVAEARKLPLVLAKRIVLSEGETVSAVLFGGIDVTDDVIAKLDRKAQ